MSGVLTAIGSLGFAGNSAPVTIGGVTLAGVEVPSVLRIGGEQQLVVTQLPGGGRTIQAMGDCPARLTLAGMFIGPGARARAVLFEQMRTAGAPVSLSLSSISLLVVLQAFSYDLAEKGAVLRYELVVEVLPAVASAATRTVSNLSALVGSDIGSALTSIAGTITNVSAYATTAIAQAQTVAGQLQPVATLIGLGGPLAKANTALQGAAVLAQAGSDIGSIPSSAASLVGGLQSSGASLMDTISQSGGSLLGIQDAAGGSGNLVSGASALTAATAQAGLLAGAVSTGALVNRAIGNAALATGAASLPVPLVYAT